MLQTLNNWLITVNLFIDHRMLISLIVTLFQNGLLSSLPFIGRFIGSLGSGMLADNLMTKEILSVTATRKIFHVSGTFLTIDSISLWHVSYKKKFCFFQKNICVNVLKWVIFMCGIFSEKLESKNTILKKTYGNSITI